MATCAFWKDVNTIFQEQQTQQSTGNMQYIQLWKHAVHSIVTFSKLVWLQKRIPYSLQPYFAIASQSNCFDPDWSLASTMTMLGRLGSWSRWLLLLFEWLQFGSVELALGSFPPKMDPFLLEETPCLYSRFVDISLKHFNKVKRKYWRVWMALNFLIKLGYPCPKLCPLAHQTYAQGPAKLIEIEYHS